MPKTILHMHNVLWLGGVTAFIADIATAFPEFEHIAAYVKDDGVDNSAVGMLESAGVKVVSMIQPVKPEDISQKDPALIISHNLSGIRFIGEHPWGWIREWPTIHWHHSPVRPTVPMDLHIFVSKHVRKKFEGLFGRIIEDHDTIPPCINTDRYSHINPLHSLVGSNLVIGKIGPKFNKDKHPAELLEIASSLDVKLLSPGSSEWYGQHSNLIAPEPSWSAVPEWLSKMSIFLFMNAGDSEPETWCRAVTEAMASGLPVVAENAGGIMEQITDMVNGMLVGKGNFEEAKAAILILKTRPKLRRSLGMAAREWAQNNASITALRRKLGPHILRLLAQ